MIERINKLMREEGLSELQFAKRVGVPQSSVNGYLAGKNAPSAKFIMSIVTEFSDVSAEWLLRGEGSMYTKDIPQDGDTDVVVDLKAEITRLLAITARLNDQVASLERERDTLMGEVQHLTTQLTRSERRLDKLIDILHQEPDTPSFSLAAERPAAYSTDNTLK